MILKEKGSNQMKLLDQIILYIGLFLVFSYFLSSENVYIRLLGGFFTVFEVLFISYTKSDIIQLALIDFLQYLKSYL